MVPWVGLYTVIVAFPAHSVAFPHGAMGLSVNNDCGISGSFFYFPHGAMGLSVNNDCGISWSFCVFSSWCHGFVCVMWLWHFLVILCLCLMVPWVYLYTLILAFPGHSVSLPRGAMGLSVYCDLGISWFYAILGSLPRGAMGLSVYFDCGISWSYSVFSSWCHGLVCIL